MGKLSFLKAIPFFSLANLAKLDLNPFVTVKDLVTIIQMHCKKFKTRNPWVGSYKPRVSIQIPSNFNQERG